MEDLKSNSQIESQNLENMSQTAKVNYLGFNPNGEKMPLLVNANLKSTPVTKSGINNDEDSSVSSSGEGKSSLSENDMTIRSTDSETEKIIKIEIEKLREVSLINSTKPTNKWPQILAAIGVSLGSLMVGFATAYTSPAIKSMNSMSNDSLLWIELEGEEASWIGSLMPLGALVGGIIGGTLLELIGRKRTILATALPFIISGILIGLATHISMIYIARAIIGICVGIMSLSLPIYLAETVQPEIRGALGLLPTTLGNSGILVAYVGGMYFNWRNLAYLGSVLVSPFLITMMFIPETPRWYISHNKEFDGEKSLQWFRGKGANINTELNEIKANHIKSLEHVSKITDLFGRKYMKPVLVTIGLMLFQQFSGINAVIFYANTIFTLTGSEMSPDTCSIIIGIVNIAATVFATGLIDLLGRKVLLIISETLMMCTLALLGIFFYNKEAMIQYSWLPLSSFILFVIAFSLGFGPIPWLMMGEILPARIRNSAAALATSFNWTCTFIVTKCFPLVIYSFGIHVAFFGFSVICSLGLVFIIFFVPETKGKSLEEIEHIMSPSSKIKLNSLKIDKNTSISALANLKPLPNVT